VKILPKLLILNNLADLNRAFKNPEFSLTFGISYPMFRVNGSVLFKKRSIQSHPTIVVPGKP